MTSGKTISFWLMARGYNRNADEYITVDTKAAKGLGSYIAKQSPKFPNETSASKLVDLLTTKKWNRPSWDKVTEEASTKDLELHSEGLDEGSSFTITANNPQYKRNLACEMARAVSDILDQTPSSETLPEPVSAFLDGLVSLIPDDKKEQQKTLITTRLKEHARLSPPESKFLVHFPKMEWHGYIESGYNLFYFAPHEEGWIQYDETNKGYMVYRNRTGTELETLVIHKDSKLYPLIEAKLHEVEEQNSKLSKQMDLEQQEILRKVGLLKTT